TSTRCRTCSCAPWRRCAPVSRPASPRRTATTWSGCCCCRSTAWPPACRTPADPAEVRPPPLRRGWGPPRGAGRAGALLNGAMPSSLYSDLSRPPLDQRALQRALVRPGALWTGVDVVPSLGSTNTELVARANDGAPGGTVLVTEHQTAGRGRLGRSFSTPARAALTFSVLLRPTVPPHGYGWLPLLMGVAAVHGVRRIAAVRAELKWPNDVLVGGRKLAGILSEAAFGPAGPAVVIGIGLNVSQSREELPVDTATSLALSGAACTDRDPLLRAVLRAFAEHYTRWVE